jgi:2,3-bisphosphoglycerate-independent phosphoglycerate mutase
MSADQLTSEVYDRLVKNPVYSFALVNFANADMVGHTGNLKAAIRAVETVDGCIGRLARLVMAFGGTMLITADHGNAEQMQGANGEVNTEHSGNPVPFIAISKKFVGKAQMLPLGILGDVAPTALSLMGLPQATNMTGRNLLASIQKTRRR